MSSHHTLAASGHPLTTEAALRTMAAGGNAFDGIVAAAFTATITEPALTSLGGGGFLLARTKDGREILFDFFTDTPGLGRTDPTRDPHFFTVPVNFPATIQNFNVGLGSVAVPGNLLGFLHVHRRLGRLPLETVLAPAVEAAEHGVEINHSQGYFLHLLQPILTMTEAGQCLFAPNSSFLQVGDRFRNQELAAYLRHLPDERGDSFYKGKLARLIETEMNYGGGLLTAADLAAYRVIERKPLALEYRGRRLLTNPPPSFGGTLIGATMQLMDRLPFDQDAWGSLAHLGGLASVLEAIDENREQLTGHDSPINGDWLAPATEKARPFFSRGTTHISVADGLGNCGALTASNGEGSGYLVPETGIMLNNMLGEDDLHPEGFHTAPAGVRVASMMSPSLLVGRQGVELITGSGGSKRIRTAIPQVISNIIDFGLPVDEALCRPRIHWDGETMQIEPGFPEETLEGVRKRWPVNIWSDLDMYFGGVHTIHDGEYSGDPRRGGCGGRGVQGMRTVEQQNKDTQNDE